MSERTADTSTADCRRATTTPVGAGRLFPHAVCRVAGLPVDSFEALRSHETTRLADALAAAESELAGLAPALTDLLYTTIGDTGDRKLRGKLLGLRRDVHNLRPVSVARVRRLAERLDAPLAADLAAYAAVSVRRDAFAAAVPTAYERDLVRVRRAFQRAVAGDDFRRGLLLSSRVLVGELERYRRTPVDAMTAKERQVERGLLRYLSRMAMKTTPYGTFTAIVPGRLVAEGAAGDGSATSRFEGDPGTKRSLVRLNQRIWTLLRHELGGDPEVRARLGVELNPTLHLEGSGDGRWRFLADRGGKEVFQRLERNPVLDLYQQLLAAGPRRFDELVATLAGHPEVDAGGDEVTAYTDRLVEIGFLGFRWGVAPQEADWDRPLAALLDDVPGEAAARAARLVAELRRRRDAFAVVPGTAGGAQLDAAVAAMREAYPQLVEGVGGRPPEVPFYEDAGADARLLVPRDDLAAVEASLATYVRLSARLGWPRHEMALMRAFFDRHYADGWPAVPLLRFYEDYYREYFKRRLARHEAPADAPADDDDELAAAVDDVWKGGYRAHWKLLTAVAERWRRDPEAAEIELTREDFEAAVAEVPPASADDYSVSVFAQLLPGEAADGGPALLVSSLLRGFGKYFSRFLDLLPEGVHADLLRRNRDTGDVLLAEISAQCDFNADLHPPLVPWEIGYPTVESGTGGGRIEANALVVEAHPEDPHALRLTRGHGGKAVMPLDLGFKNPRMRPPLFQLLSHFAPACNFGPRLPESPQDGLGSRSAGGEGDEAPEPRVVHRPRVVFDGRLVVARRRWQVPHDLFPRREAAESDADYFLRADRWRRRHGVPREVFVSLHQERGAKTAPRGDDGEPLDLRNHVHKPQYVDFANPLLVDLFGRLVDDDDPRQLTILLHERLPHRRHLPAAESGDRYATELVLQVDFPDGFATSEEDGDG